MTTGATPVERLRDLTTMTVAKMTSAPRNPASAQVIGERSIGVGTMVSEFPDASAYPWVAITAEGSDVSFSE